MLPALFQAMWNLGDKDREEWETKLPMGIRNKFHLNFVDPKTKELTLFAPQLPIDVLPGINIPSIIVNNAIRAAHGEISKEEMVKSIFKDTVQINKEVLLRLANPLLRFGTGMWLHQDPYDNAKVYPTDIKDLTTTARAKYSMLYFSKTCVPLVGNYMNRKAMNHDDDAFSHVFEAWKSGYHILGFKEDVPEPVGAMDESMKTKNYLTNTPSKKFIGYDVRSTLKGIDNEIREVRRDFVGEFSKVAPSRPDSGEVYNKLWQDSIKKLEEIVPSQDIPKILPNYFSNLIEQLKSSGVQRDVLKNEKDYLKDRGEDYSKAKQLESVNRMRMFIDNLKKVGREAKTQLPRVIANIESGNPSRGNMQVDSTGMPILPDDKTAMPQNSQMRTDKFGMPILD